MRNFDCSHLDSHKAVDKLFAVNIGELDLADIIGLYEACVAVSKRQLTKADRDCIEWKINRCMKAMDKSFANG